MRPGDIARLFESLKPSTLYIEKQIADTPEVCQIQSKLKLPATLVTGSDEIYAGLSAENDPIGAAKKILFLTKKPGCIYPRLSGNPSLYLLRL